MKKSLSLLAIFGLLLSFGLINHASANAPGFADIPDVKLFINQGLTPAFDLLAYDSTADTDAVNSAAINTNFLNKSSITSTLSGTTITSAVVNYGPYSAATSGANAYQLSNAGGNGIGNNKVKWSSYKLGKIGSLVLRAGDSRTVSLSAIDSTGNPVNPPSFGNPAALSVSDTTQISAVWDPTSTKVIVTALAGFNAAANAFVSASPVASGAVGGDVDKENIAVYPAINSTAFDFNVAGDETILANQIPAGATTPATVTRVATINDGAGSASRGGALSVAFTAATDGSKLTPGFSAWLPNTPGQWYTARVRVFGTNPANSYLQAMFNGVAASTPTDIQGYFRFAVPTTWTEIDIPLNSASAVSSGNVMYPQLVLKAASAAGTIYVDDIRIFAAAPTVIGASRKATADGLVGGHWNDSSATTSWSIANISGTNPSINVTNGQLQLGFPASGTQNAIKFTASTAAGTIYTVGATIGKGVGAHMYTQLLSGTADLSLTQVQVNLLGATGAGSFVQGGDINATAEVGRVSSRTLRTAVNLAAAANYQVQFIAKHGGASAATIAIDNTLADVDGDDPNYGDISLFP